MAPLIKRNLKRKSGEQRQHNKPVKSADDKPPSLQFDDDVPDFPRGGGSRLSREERDGIKAEVDEEFDTELRDSKRTKSKKKKNVRTTIDDDFGSLFGEGISGKLPRFANKITFQNIAPGMKLFGVVAEVNEKDLAVSLPGGLRGLVRASEAVESALVHSIKDLEGHSLASLYHVGQLVSCVVLQVDDDDKKETGKKKVWLSSRLSLLHKGYSLDAVQEGMILTANVKSIEDHGYILDFGVSSFTGFFPKKSNEDAKLTPGQLVQGVVKKIDKVRKVLYLSTDRDIVSKCVMKDLKGISLDLLVPGMMVDARIQSTLENGIMLSFLTYFTGTVDIFHLQNAFPSSNWKKQYEKNKKVNARILFIDPSSRAVGLTMNPHLLLNKAPPSHVRTGEIYEHSKVIRVDKDWGLLLEIPSSPAPTPAYVTISDVADKDVHKLEKSYREGIDVRVRILGFRHLEGLAMGVLKASAFEGAVFTHADVKPGMVVKAKVIAVNSSGAFVQFPSGVKAHCPLPHMSEYDIDKPRKKFKVGAELVFRVLGCKSKRITLTHKKTLVKSKLSILSSYTDATEGLVTHGWISKIDLLGCFVRFYNGVHGFAPRSELGLEPRCDTTASYHVGQVVKCRVTSSCHASHRINLSFIISPTKVSEDDAVKLGSVVSGVVELVMPNAIYLHVNVKGNMKGTVYIEHLADHQRQSVQLKSVLKPGHELSQLLVLDIEGHNLILSAKYSLIHAIPHLPADTSQITLNSVINGYVCNLIETGCFVRFLGRLTGFSPRKKALDDRNTNLSEAFFVGQSVRCNILEFNNESDRLTLSLKQSHCSSTDTSFLQSYFSTEEKIAALQVSNLNSSELDWPQNLNVGSVVEGRINEAKDFGVVISFEKYSDVFGFISQHQMGGKTLETGSTVRAVVLDVSKSERLVDLTLKPEFVEKSERNACAATVAKKKRKRESKEFKLHETVKAVVEVVKEDYLVLSLPEHNYSVGYAAVTDYNMQRLRRKQFSTGETVVATIMALPSDLTAGRLLLLLESCNGSLETSISKKAKKRSGYDIGSLVHAEITDIKPLEMWLKFGMGFRGRVHIAEVNDEIGVEDPFSAYKVGQTLTARIVANSVKPVNNKKGSPWELSLKPSILSGSTEIEKMQMAEDFNFTVGQHVSGYVYKVDKEWVWLAVSRQVKAKLFILDSACEPSDLENFQKRFRLGAALSGYILSMNREWKSLRLVMRSFSAISNGLESSASDEKEVCHIHNGDVLGGRVWKILPGVGGILVQIGPHIYGKVHYTELADPPVSDPLSGYNEGQFVKCKVLEINYLANSSVHIDLSFRIFEDTINGDSRSNCIQKIGDLQPDMVVNGYVKSVTPKGCFILLSRNIDAMIKVSNLSDGYVEDPVKEFPVGKLVKGKILSVEPLSKRVEVTLKADNKNSRSELSNFGSLNVGDVVRGRIKRVESFGLFIVIDNVNLVGLCHVSEISDDHVDDLDDQFKAGERVTAKVLKVDVERHRISLGMKSSYFEDEDHGNNEMDVDSVDNSITLVNAKVDMPQVEYSDSTFELEDESALIQVESRASVPPLEVTLDDMEDDEMFDQLDNKETIANGSNAIDEKSNRQAKKKAKEEKEQQIRAAEQRLLEVDIPRTSDEFEKAVRSSPNSSFVWIKYMQFMLSMADVEGARSVAERALKTIKITCETEKLNVWVAYLNLENQYGNPSQEAVVRLFQRALQFCDHLKLHLELLGLYERTEQHKLANELLDKMVKKFKQSCEVWLRRIQWFLKQNPEEVDKMMNRALLSLPKHEHIQFLSQVAILQFKIGVPDKARSIFEKMLREYPKRRDLWSVYLDQEIRLGDVDIIRALFERATSLSLPAKKMKFLFKKYHKYEKSLGDENRAQYVIKKAKEYAETSAI
ncbi:rRNA biogenesis protein RRP5-like isoform X2 [Chenopodium quinoa]|uniref:rRNA biogenesis protein RRP5-like isoform X2 n=1 Tax=Chenopodium quinoa TaxID=63459 RepID=UPI000B791062|nr:rRNA biogenesis protein RRP5-like isoform X2 [Chenopodium quinoa]